jgi:hypothetical protein|tara:strand:- start:5 stop:235 length:231 start_codon:yes stop_codon:yes gene_type:complete
MNCSNCGGADDGFRATLKGSKLEWIEDILEDGDALCESCAHQIAHEADMENRQYQESRDIHEDGHWDGEHFYPSAG